MKTVSYTQIYTVVPVYIVTGDRYEQDPPY